MSNSFYVTGGTVSPGTPSYVERQADRELFEALARGEFCYVLHARQMGKSSLMAHATAGLTDQGKTFRAAGTPVTFSPPLPRSVYVGLAVTAHNAGEISEAKFSDLRIERR